MQFDPRRRFAAAVLNPRRRVSAAALVCMLVSMSACNLDNLGNPPPEANIYLPTGLALSTQSSDTPPRILYVVNSNFDLLYNSGSVQAFDLERIDAAIAACPKQGSECVIDPKTALLDEVLVPSHTTSLGFTPDHSRLFVATRTDASLSYIDVDESADGEDILRCGESERRCSDAFKRGNDPSEGGPRRLTLPMEPVGLISLAASNLDASDAAEPTSGDYVMVAHRAGQVSLFYDDTSGPQLVDVLEGQPLELTGLAFDPTTRLSYLSVYARNATTFGLPRVLGRIGIAPDPDPRRAFLYDVGPLSIDGVAAQRDTRGVSVNPLADGQTLVVSRDPAALLWVDVAASLNGDANPYSAPTRRIVSMALGPSRLTVAPVGERTVAAVSCFDSQEIFVIDVATGDVLSIVHNLNGPFELGIDSFRRRLYVADFRSSVVRVLDLAPIVEGQLGGRTDVSVIATFGLAKVVQELQ